MARISKSQRLLDVHGEALRRFRRCSEATQDDRQLSREDRRFCWISGAQFEGPMFERESRRPKLEMNKVARSVIRLEGEHRANRCTVDFLPKDGSDGDELADVCDGLYRADEQDSPGGQGAYDNGFTDAVTGGFGAWRYRACEEDEYSGDGRQRIRIETIVDADTSVYFDIDSKDQNKADARYAFVLTAKTWEAYKADYGDDPASWPKDTDIGPFVLDWYTPSVVYVAEYYVCEKAKVKMFEVTPALGEPYELDEDELDPEYDEDDVDDDGLPKPTPRQVLEAQGATIEEIEPRKVKRVHKYLMSGARVLEDCGVIAGTEIPIVPVYGKRVFIDNKERWIGHVRFAKDAQRILNMLISRLAEIGAYSTIKKPIFAPEQIDGFQEEWRTDNEIQRPYLRANPLMDVEGNPMHLGPIGFTEPPPIPEALAALLQFVSTDIKELLNDTGDREKVVGNISGKAREIMQQALDACDAIYLDNFALAMKRGGEIWKEMAKDVYVEKGRKMKMIGADGRSRSTVTLKQPGLTDDNVRYMKNDLSVADFDVVVDVGPQTATKKSATVHKLIELLQVVPQEDTEARTVLARLAIMNMDGEGMTDAQTWARKGLVMQGVVKPDEEEQKMLEAQQAAAAKKPPDPQQQLLIAAAQKEAALAKKAEHDSMKSQAETVRTIAQVDLTQAQTMKTKAEATDTVGRLGLEAERAAEEKHRGDRDFVHGQINRAQDREMERLRDQRPKE